MVAGKRLERAYCHFEGHLLNSVLSSKVDEKVVVFYLCNDSNAPCSVVNEIFYAESNVLFKIVDCFKYVAEILCKV